MIKKKYNAKKIIQFLHEWLGISSGLIVFIVALSGTLFVFCDEVIDAFAGDAKYVTSISNTQKLSPTTLIKKYEEVFPERGYFYFDTYKAENRSFRIASHKNLKDFSYTYINPYTGEIIKTSKSYWFFYVVAAKIHSQILIGKTGQTVVAISTIIFLFGLISGLILWWPKKWNKTAKKTAFTIKKGTKWKRKTLDLHKVLGFYALIPAILITFTGLIMAYEVLANFTQETFGGIADEKTEMAKYTSKFDENKKAVSLDKIVSSVTKKYPEAKQIRISTYLRKNQTFNIAVVADYIGLKTSINGIHIMVDRYSGNTIETSIKLDKHHKIEQTVFDLHVGHWYGLTGKIITFIVGLICTSLPVTGFIFWYGRKRKKNRKKKKNQKTYYMKTYKIFFILTLMFACKSYSQTKIEIGEKHTLFSTILNEEREYWVYLPPNYNDTIYAPEKYPVVYFLDGDRHFHSLTGIHDFLSKGPYASLPQMIMVGILTKKNRDRDLTPTNVNKPQLGKRFYFPNSGGNEKFMIFIEDELITTINSKYRTNGYKTLIGHSFGGLTVLNTILTKKNLFNSYIAIDPSIWWDDRYVLRKAKKKLKTLDFTGTTLYFVQAYTNPTPQDTARWHERAIVGFKNELEKNADNGLKWEYRLFKEDDHGTISLPSEYFGLKYLYKGYQAPVKMIANHPEMFTEAFEKLSKKMDFEIKPSEARVDWIASYCLRTKRADKAIELLKINQKNYPNSIHVYTSLGDCYAKIEDSKNAEIEYKKALKIDPSSEKTKEKLNKLH